MMFSMNPDPASWLTLEGGELAFDQYPDGSFQFRIVGNTNTRWAGPLVLKSTLPAALMAAAQVRDAWVTHFPNNLHLRIQTLPDQRGDKPGKPGACISSRVTARMIAALGFSSISVYDVHSPEALNWLRDALAESDILIVHSALECASLLGDIHPASDAHIVAVDAGARGRARAFADAHGADLIFMDKKRDPDGAIIGHEIIEHQLTLLMPVEPDSEIWVVDDLCDGGATFISVANAIRTAYPSWQGKLKLYVTHGIFSKGRAELLKHYSDVYSLFSYDDWRS